MWSNPEVIGQCETLYGGFVIEKLNNTRTLVFGGADVDTKIQSSSVYLLDISISTVVCSCMCII